MNYIFTKIDRQLILFVVAFFLAAVQVVTAAGTGAIKGKIADKETKEALIGANIIVKGTSLGAATDFEGKYILKNIPAGKVDLVVSYIGYSSTTISVTVSENETLEQNIFLEPQSLTGQTVVITAQAEGQLSAINQQLSSNTIENVVSKARIKELPDVNAAESIGRLPGVSIQRYGGEATKVEIRGLDPKYSLISVNGVELPATGSQDRSVDLSLISSNMLDGIVLKKVVTPDMDADVLGGTVDLKLKEAPSGFNLNASLQGGYNELQKYYNNYNFTVSASNRYLNEKLGIIINANVDNYDRSADKFQDTWNRWTEATIVTGFLNLREEKVNRKRAGASLLLDYVIPNGKITANGFFNQLNSDNEFHINQIFTPSAAYSTNRHYYQLEQQKTTTNVYTSSLAITQDFGWIRYDANVSRTGTATNDPNHRVWQFGQESQALNADLYYPTMSPQNIAASTNDSLQITWMAYMYRYGTRLIENTTAARLNFEIPFSFTEQLSGKIKTGAKLRWIDRSNDQSQYGYGGLQYGNGGNALNVVFTYLNQVYPSWNIDSVIKQDGGLSITPFLTNYSRSNFLNGDYPIGLIPNQPMMNQMMDALIAAPADKRLWLPYSIGNYGSDYSGFERYEAGYLMGEFNFGTMATLIPGVRWEGEFTSYNGQRYQQVQSGQAPEQPPAGFVNLNKIRNNAFWLPMVNLIVKPINWLQVKLARTETLARPQFLEYAPISYLSGDNSYMQAANYSLRPAQSTNYDVAVSVFNNEIGLFSASGFYKNVKDLIFFATFPLKGGIKPDPNLEIPVSWYQSSAPTVNTYMNNPNPAYYYGFELEWQTHFWYLPSVLSGLVLNVNYTHIYSEMMLQYDSLVIKTVGTRRQYSLASKEVKTRMPDQPAHIFNITIGYDLGGFSARLSYLYQTDKLTSIGYEGVIPSTRFSTYTGSYGRWDLSLQQKLFEHLQVFANFNNLNSRPDNSYVGSELNNPSYIEYYGFTMDVGFRYNF